MKRLHSIGSESSEDYSQRDLFVPIDPFAPISGYRVLIRLTKILDDPMPNAAIDPAPEPPAARSAVPVSRCFRLFQCGDPAFQIPAPTIALCAISSAMTDYCRY